MRLWRAVLLVDEPFVREFLQTLQSREPQEARATFLEVYASTILATVRLFERDSDAVGECFLFVCEGLVRHRFRRLRPFRYEYGAGELSFDDQKTGKHVAIQTASLRVWKSVDGQCKVAATIG